MRARQFTLQRSRLASTLHCQGRKWPAGRRHCTASTEPLLSLRCTTARRAFRILRAGRCTAHGFDSRGPKSDAHRPTGIAMMSWVGDEAALFVFQVCHNRGPVQYRRRTPSHRAPSHRPAHRNVPRKSSCGTHVQQLCRMSSLSSRRPLSCDSSHDACIANV